MLSPCDRYIGHRNKTFDPIYDIVIFGVPGDFGILHDKEIIHAKPILETVFELLYQVTGTTK